MLIPTVSAWSNLLILSVAFFAAAALMFFRLLRLRRRKGLIEDREWDLVVVGAGAAGFAASISAKEARAEMKVLLLDAGDGKGGGTSAKSGGGVWIPNNELKRGLLGGREESEEAFLRFVAASKGSAMTRMEALRALAFFRAGSEAEAELRRLGLPLELPANVTGAGKEANREFMRKSGLPESDLIASSFCDYSLRRNESGIGRTLHPKPSLAGQLSQLAQTLGEISLLTLLRYTPDVLTSKYSKQGNGADLVRGLRRIALEGKGCALLNRARVTSIDQFGGRFVLQTAEGPVSARKVVVACGGAGASKERANEAVGFATRGSCCAREARGDLTGAAGALSNPSAWLKQTWTEVGGEEEYVLGGTLGIWFMAGSSSFLVDKRGRRFVNEASAYPIRTRAQIERARTEVAVYVCDEHTRRRYASLRATGGVLPETPLCGGCGADKRWVHRSETWEELLRNAGEALEASLRRMGAEVDVEAFRANLDATRRRWDQMVGRQGLEADDDFRRGESAENLVWPYIHPDDAGKKNPCVRPLSAEGPYYAVLVSAAVLDTVGEFYTDERWRAVNATTRRPIEGLYAAGNSATAVLDRAVYLSGGFTLGHALASGWSTGKEAALVLEEEEKKEGVVASFEANV